MPNPIIEKVNVGGQDFDIAGSGQGNSIVHYDTEAAMDADWSNIDNESDIVTEEEDDYDLTASMIAYGQNSNVEDEIDRIKADLTDLENNKIGTPIDLTAYSISNLYTFPSDGYVCATAGGQASAAIGVRGSDGKGEVVISAFSATSDVRANSMFVKKGCKGYGVIVSAPAAAEYRPLNW